MRTTSLHSGRRHYRHLWCLFAFLAPTGFSFAAVAAAGATESSGTCATSSGYAQLVLADRPLAFFPLGITTGNGLCDATGAAHGSYAPSGVTFGVPGPPGASPNGAIATTGSVDPATAPGPTALHGNHNLTLEGWYNSTTRSDQMLVDLGVASHDAIIGLGVWSPDQVEVDMYQGSQGFDASRFGVELNDGRWHFIAATYTASTRTLRYYADGHLLGTYTVTTPMALMVSPVRIGWWVDTIYNQPFDGAMADIAIYGSVLSGAQLDAQYSAGAGGGSTGPSSIATALPTPAGAFGSVAHDALILLLSACLMAFIVFPAQLFNTTFEENYPEISRRFSRRFKGATTSFKKMADHLGDHRDRVAIGIVIAIGGLLGGLLDPQFGMSARSAALYIALILTTLIGIVLGTVVAHQYRRVREKDRTFNYHAIPTGLVIAAVCVIVTRAVAFEPGYLYGVVCGVVFTSKLTDREDAHIVGLSSVTSIGVAVLAWLCWDPINHLAVAHTGDFPLIVLDDLLAAIFAGSLGGMLINLLPLQFLPGHKLASWHRGIWSAVFLTVMFGFLGIVVWPNRGGNPHPGDSMITTIVLFAAFAALSLGFWWYFDRYRKRSEEVEHTSNSVTVAEMKSLGGPVLASDATETDNITFEPIPNWATHSKLANSQGEVASDE